MPVVCVIAVPQSPNARSNFAFGLETSVWGFTRYREQLENLADGTPVLMATDFDRDGNASPRVSEDAYFEGTMGRVVLARASGPLEESNSPHWPDEVESGKVTYPWRVPLLPLATAANVVLSGYPRELSDAFHSSILTGATGIFIDLAGEILDRLAVQAELEYWPAVTVEGTPGVAPDEFRVGPTKAITTTGGGQGYLSDPATRIATERRAVDLAVGHYEAAGWAVTEKGKPYDLLCVREGEELHVEVKGSTGRAGTVHLTINEVLHAGRHPTELFIVSDIVLNRQVVPPTASGGIPTVFKEWVPAEDALRATRFEYVVPWIAASS